MGYTSRDLCSSSVKVLCCDTKSLLGLLFTQVSRLSSQSLSLKAFPPAFKAFVQAPSLSFSVLNFRLLPAFSLLKQQHFYYSSNGDPNAPLSCKLLSPHKLAVLTQRPSPWQGTGSSCYIACFIGPL